MVFNFRKLFLQQIYRMHACIWDTGLKNDFSRVEDIVGSQIHIERTDQGKIQVEGNDSFYSSGFQLLSMGSDGKPSQKLQISENHFTLHFMEYVGWQKTLELCIRYIATILPRLNLEKNGIQSFNLRYVDRFTFDGQTDEANAGLLFQQSSEFISSKCFDAGPYWHCHSGWFDNNYADSRILNQLNIQSRMIDNAATVTIDHNMVFRLRSSFNSVNGFMGSVDGKNFNLKESLDHLHNINHDVISGLLCSNMAERIGISNESS